MNSFLNSLVALALNACTLENSMDNKAYSKQEKISSSILENDFSDLKSLQRFLESENVKYLIKEDKISDEPPNNRDIAWNEYDRMYYLVLLPKNPKMIYRFRVYSIGTDFLHVETDYAYKNPYQ